MKLQMLKRALIAYVSNSAKAIWSVVAHPLTIVGSKNGNVKDYKIYGGDTELSVIPITIRGKNIINLDEALDSSLLKNDDGTYTLKKVSTSSGGRMSGRATMHIPANTKIAYGFDIIEYQRSTSNFKKAIGLQLNYADGTQGNHTLYDNDTGTPTGNYHNYTVPKEVSTVQLYLHTDDEVGDYIKFDNFQIEISESGTTQCEPYIEPQTVNIQLDEPLGTGQVIQMSKDNLPKLPQFKGTTVYEAQTEIPPSGIQVQYYG